MTEFNKDFKQQREDLKLTQQEAAVIIGVSRITYIKWENDPDSMPVGKYEQLIAEFARLKTLKQEG